MTDLIQDLIKNERPFGLMSEEMQAKYGEIRRESKAGVDFLIYSTSRTWLPISNLNVPNANSTYRLRSDYEDKPGIVECKIEPDDEDGFLVYSDPHENCMSQIHYAPMWPDFIGFKYEDGLITHAARMYKSKGNSYSCHAISKDDEFEDFEVLTPTHVLFRSKL